MAYPSQGYVDPKNVLMRSKISDETWEMLINATNTKRMRKVLRRIFRSASEQNEE